MLFDRRTLLVGLCGGLAGCASVEDMTPPKPGQGIDLDVRGKGAPPIVLIHGLGDTRDTWSGVMGDLSAVSTVMAANRPGYGRTTLTTSPRTAQAAIIDLDAALTQAGLVGPHILVGHSLGGIYALAYARSKPKNVAGLVLVDPTVPGQTKMMWATAFDMMKVVRVAVGMQGRAALREFDDAETAESGVAAMASYPGPTIVLAAQKIDPAMPREVVGFRRDQMKSLSAGTGSELRAVDCGHYIQRERPDVVIKAVSDLLARAKKA